MDACREAEHWLQQELDGELAASAGTLLQRHLDTCAQCRQLAGELRQLREEVEALPPVLEPTRDLWPEIAANLPEREVRSNRPGMAHLVRGGVWQAIAALLLLVIGGFLGQLFTEPALDPRPIADQASVLEASLLQIEADYLRAKESLWLELLARRNEIDPQTLELVSRNFRTINQATEDLRRALELQPGQPELEALLLAQYEREIDLLRRFVRLTA